MTHPIMKWQTRFHEMTGVALSLRAQEDRTTMIAKVTTATITSSHSSP
jgi:hypothetical protein